MAQVEHPITISETRSSGAALPKWHAGQSRADLPSGPTMPTDSELVELQQTLYSSRNPTRRWLHVSRRARIRDLILRHAPQRRRRALEIGPGSGVYLSLLAELFDEAHASDIESAYLDHARLLMAAHANLTLTVDDITRSALPAGHFDLILCSEVIEHVPDSRAALANMARLLAPGGVLVLSTPQRFSTLELCCKIAFLPGIIDLVRKVYREPVLETGHINLLTTGQVRRQLADAGLATCESQLSGLYLPVIAEFTGRAGLQVAKWLEGLVARTPARSILWTQYHVAKPIAATAAAARTPHVRKPVVERELVEVAV
ncbi:MAG: class I SAM-dependent methyltransferase [Phycisphaerales bacterium]|nr:class I SAM-dependent methyltransferase [Phycisphaerales bacterium]